MNESDRGFASSPNLCAACRRIGRTNNYARMKKYFVLYMAAAKDFQDIMSRMGSMTPEEQKAGMKEWEDWAKTTSGVADMGAPLGKTKRVTADDISNTRNEIGGYSIIEADSHDAAAKMMQSNPHFKMIPGGWIEVMEIMPM